MVGDYLCLDFGCVFKDIEDVGVVKDLIDGVFQCEVVVVVDLQVIVCGSLSYMCVQEFCYVCFQVVVVVVVFFLS